MYEMVKIAGLSAVLAGALMVAAGQHETAPTAGKILTDRLDTAPTAGQSRSPANGASLDSACTGAWPYRACDAAAQPRSKVRVIAADMHGAGTLIR